MDGLGLLQAAAIVILTLVVERVVNVPRDLRRNDERIRNRDEDLATWIEDTDAELAKQLRVTRAPERDFAQAMTGMATTFGLHRDAQHRYRDQRREAERLVRDVQLSEGVAHRAARQVLRRPLPTLNAPSDKAHVIQMWREPVQRELDAREAFQEWAADLLADKQ